MVPVENKSNSFVVTLTPIAESSDLTIQSDHTDMEKDKQDRTFPEEDKLFEKPKRTYYERVAEIFPCLIRNTYSNFNTCYN